MRIKAMLFLLAVIALVGVVLAQDDYLQPLGITRTQPGTYWDTNSQSVTFFGQLDEGGEEQWITVDLNTFALSVSSSFPLHQNVTDDERQQFDLSPLAIESPNGQLLIYTRIQDGFQNPLMRTQLIIANRLTGEMFETGIFDNIELDDPSSRPLRFLWSDESNAVAIEQISFSGVPVVYHVAIPDPQNLQTAVTTSFGEPVNGVLYVTLQDSSSLIDIHPDGSRVIVRANISEVGVSRNEEEKVILEWVPLNPDQSEVVDQLDIFLGVSYAPHTDNEFVYWKLQGPVAFLQDGAFYRFDRSTNTEHLLWQSPVPIVVRSISPDGRWSIIIDENERPYLVNLYALLINLPTASAGLDQTITDTDNNGSELVTLDGPSVD